MDKYVITDWAGNRLFPNIEFTDFDEAWLFIYENVEEETEDDGTYDDYYVILIN